MTGSNASLGRRRASGFWAATQAAQQRTVKEEEESGVPGSTHPYPLIHALETIYHEEGGAVSGDLDHKEASRDGAGS